MSLGLLRDRGGLQLPLRPRGRVWWAEQKPSGFGELLLASEKSSEAGLPRAVVSFSCPVWFLQRSRAPFLVFRCHPSVLFAGFLHLMQIPWLQMARELAAGP